MQINTQETDNNLIIQPNSNQEYADFIYIDSMSDCDFNVQSRVNKKQLGDPPPNSKDGQLSFVISPISPNFEGLRDSQKLIQLAPILVNNTFKQKTSNIIIREKQQSNSGGSIMRYFHMKRFINKLLKYKLLFNKLQLKHLLVLNDVASSYNPEIFGQKQFSFRPLGLMKNLHLPQQPSITKYISNKLTKVQRYIIRKIDHLNQIIPVIQPENKGKMGWDLLLSVTRLYFIILIPIDMVIEERLLYSDELIMVTIIQTIICILDVLLTFNTAYFEFGQIVSERQKIIKHTFSKGFGLDVFSVIYLTMLLFINWDTIGDNEPLLFVGSLAFLVQYQNITKLTRIFEEVLNLNKIQAGFLELAKLITLLIYIIHIASCIWLGCGRISYNLTQDSWLVKEDLINEIWIVRYLRSFYFCTVTMFTVGYGDITPQSNIEYCLCIIYIMIFSIQLPYSVNTVGAIIAEISKYSEQKLQKLRMINTYMTRKRISYELQVKIRQYLTFYWDCQNTQLSSEVNIIVEQLSENLRESLMLEANQVILNGCDLFSKYFSPQLKKALVSKIRYMDVSPDNIVDFNDQSDSYQNNYLAFIENGIIEVIQDQNICKNDQSIKQLETGQVFGLYEFIAECKQTEFYKSKGFTRLLVLPKNQFLLLLKDFPEDKEKYCQIRDDLLYNNGEKFRSQIGLRCFMCNSSTHLCKDCPSLHFIPDKEKTIKSFAHHGKQQRINKQRSNLKDSFNGISDQQMISEIAQYFREDFWKECQFYEITDNQQEQQHPQPTSPLQPQSKTNISLEEVDEIIQAPQLSSKISNNYQEKKERQTKITQLIDQQQFKRAGRKNTISPIIRMPTRTIITDQSNQQQNSINLPRAQSSQFEETSQPDSRITPEKQEAESVLKSSQKLVGDYTQLKVRTKKVQTNIPTFSKRLKNLQIQISTNQTINQFESTQIEYIENQYYVNQRLIQLTNISDTQHHCQELEFLQKSINSHLEEDFSSLYHMDIQKNFEFYLPNNNFSNLQIIQNSNQRILFLKNFSKYVKYLIYPFEYIKKYQPPKSTQVTKLEHQPKTISFSKKMTVDTVLKFRNKAKQLISSRRIVPE